MTTSLFEVFEDVLHSSEIANEISTDKFVSLVIQRYFNQLKNEGRYFSSQDRAAIEEELQFEVTSMTRKKTYGYFSLNEYRRAQLMRGSKRP